MTDKTLTAEDLPMTFQAKYLGCCKAAGLWGIKHTRKPVDFLVESAKSSGQALKVVEIKVSTNGLHIQDLISKNSKTSVTHAIDSISYGVQDLTFTRVFCMIICNSRALEDSAKGINVAPQSVGNTGQQMQENLFMCHAFACESKHQARQLTFALAAAFKHFADVMKCKQDKEKLVRTIDLRTADQIADEESETEA
ncbi:uncharacterized protein [Atheta coriaria]|uniref:uncharacterized protein n=1 Tax=Dalotia coriaria TaxID=877792 RepID=UPI0031F35341